MKPGAKSPGAGDGKLDVVVWRIFSDGRSGGLIGFGQCKTGIHWKTHLTKLQPRHFCGKYLQEPLILDPIRVYMVPNRVDGAEWNSHTSEGGLLLDRCRLVQYYHISKDVFGNCRTWLNAALDRQRKGKFHDMMRHRFHSLCPYFAMFPESFAEHWIRRLTKPNETVLDPFSGRGTTALTALLCGRNAISSDVNDVAICLTRAKTGPPSLSRLKARRSQLRKGFNPRAWQETARDADEFFQHAYAPGTFRELLYLRETLDWRESRVDNLLAALTLGALHGEASSKRYLSNQMPRTISTKLRYSVNFWKTRQLVAPERDVFVVLSEMAAFRYESPIPQGESIVQHTDMRNLPRVIESTSDQPLQCAITSPPYLNVTSFEEDQWLRLRHGTADSYWSFIGDMWRCLGAIMAGEAHVVIRIGSRRGFTGPAQAWAYRLWAILRAQGEAHEP